MIRFFFIVNRSCKTRYAKYYQTIQDTPAFELEIARKCITRKQNQTLFFQLDEYKIVYRVYASLYFIIGCDLDDNEFSMLELIQLCVETMNQTFEKATELDLVFNLEKVHMIIDEVIAKGLILETNQQRLLNFMGSLYSI
ncbi:putative AP-4 complex subunit sigma-1 [Rhizopus microsporus var. microsporus]|uniref:AP complex subunit sigma n=2 Tax=Rhizopus microsporus TaxID=58291 RepID=A0A2G4SUS4_RHIZD|nr:putative AP-4 complex subunit sigma-1 [Rhizopus microsporus ATCC 52813]ORE07627.1 putative AP-4 complex subunit sigma-1 [Rhizopus microsporus var. microsporus]PHZ12510.1 putative AP-4 complex subunit sigma-1 [Rhizopus microsporus ATCC 52813]